MDTVDRTTPDTEEHGLRAEFDRHRFPDTTRQDALELALTIRITPERLRDVLDGLGFHTATLTGDESGLRLLHAGVTLATLRKAYDAGCQPSTIVGYTVSYGLPVSDTVVSAAASATDILGARQPSTRAEWHWLLRVCAYLDAVGALTPDRAAGWHHAPEDGLDPWINARPDTTDPVTWLDQALPWLHAGYRADEALPLIRLPDDHPERPTPNDLAVMGALHQHAR